MKFQFLYPILLLCILSLSKRAHSQGLVNLQKPESGKIFMYGDNLYLVKPLEGVACFDLSDAKKPKQIGFIRLDGVIDIVVKGAYIFANQYDELVVIKVDFEREKVLKELKRVKDVFPNRRKQSSSDLLSLNWYKSFEEYRERVPVSGHKQSISGSMSCMALKGNHLYTVDNNRLLTFNARITDQSQLLLRKSMQIIGSRDVETIWVDKTRVFVGAQSGVYIFDIKNRNRPKRISMYRHERSCDPVVVQDNYAYVTMRDGRICRSTVNQLTILDISEPRRPYEVFNDDTLQNPHGLSITGNVLIVCDGRFGIRIYDVSNPARPQLRQQTEGFTAYDVIQNPTKQIAIVSTPGTWKIYDMKQPFAPKELGTLSIPD